MVKQSDGKTTVETYRGLSMNTYVSWHGSLTSWAWRSAADSTALTALSLAHITGTQCAPAWSRSSATWDALQHGVGLSLVSWQQITCLRERHDNPTTLLECTACCLLPAHAAHLSAGPGCGSRCPAAMSGSGAHSVSQQLSALLPVMVPVLGGRGGASRSIAPSHDPPSTR